MAKRSGFMVRVEADEMAVVTSGRVPWLIRNTKRARICAQALFTGVAFEMKLAIAATVLGSRPEDAREMTREASMLHLTLRNQAVAAGRMGVA